MKRPPLSLVLVAVSLVTVLVVASGVLFMALFERTMPHPMNEQFTTVHYRGLGLRDAPGLLGRDWTAVTFTFPDDAGHWRVQYDQPGYNDFAAYYDNGQLREVGECKVEVMGFEPMPFPDIHDLKSSKCYRPDGSIGSEVTNGTGIQTIWTSDGTKTWELHLRDYERQLHRMWHDNGQLLVEQEYQSGLVHGPWVKYRRTGEVEAQGENHLGERVGTWKRFNLDGTVDSTEDYGPP